VQLAGLVRELRLLPLQRRQGRGARGLRAAATRLLRSRHLRQKHGAGNSVSEATRASEGSLRRHDHQAAPPLQPPLQAVAAWRLKTAWAASHQPPHGRPADGRTRRWLLIADRSSSRLSTAARRAPLTSSPSPPPCSKSSFWLCSCTSLAALLRCSLRRAESKGTGSRNHAGAFRRLGSYSCMCAQHCPRPMPQPRTACALAQPSVASGCTSLAAGPAGARPLTW
jgi:hypothetical protein